MKKTNTYKKPTIKKKNVKINYFSRNNRFIDSLDELLIPKAYACGDLLTDPCCSGSSCGGGCSGGSYP